MADEEDLYPPDEDGEDEEDFPRPKGGSMRRKILANKPQPKGGKAVGKARAGRTANQLLAQERRRKALELRKGGATYEAIAQAVGYKDPSGARKAVASAMDKITQEPATELKVLQVERYNHMLLTLWPKVQAGDERSIQTALGVMDRLERIMGIDASSGVTVNVNNNQTGILVIDGDKDAYINSMRQMAGQQAAQAAGYVAIEAGQSTHTDDVIDGEVMEWHGDATGDGTGTPDPVDDVRTSQGPPAPTFDFRVTGEKE